MAPGPDSATSQEQLFSLDSGLPLSQHMRGHAQPQNHSTREDTHDHRVTCCGHSWTCTHMYMRVYTSTRECLCTCSHVCLQEHTDTREHTHNRRVTDMHEHTHNRRVMDTHRRQAWTGTCRCLCMWTRSHRYVYAPIAMQVCMCRQALIQRHMCVQCIHTSSTYGHIYKAHVHR